MSIAISDVATPTAKAEILTDHEAKALKIQQQYDKGLITDDERRQELIEIWTQATDKVAKAMQDNLPSPEHSVPDGGVRCSW